jgi:homoserine dehydrogenase
VVTANKALMAERGGDLLALAARQGTRLRYEASVAAGIPVLGLIERALKSFTIDSVSAILNGTSNYILTRLVREGDTLSDALHEARRLGYAEADPLLDLSGVDAAQKLAILSRTLGQPLDLADVEITGLEQVNPADCARARRLGYVMKPVAAADFSGVRARGYVAPALVPKDHPLAGVWDAANGILLCGEPLGSLFLSGPGAGALPTAASILDDLLVLALEENGSHRKAEPPNATRAIRGTRGPGGEPDRLPGRWFLSMTLRRGRARVEDLLDFMAAAGAAFRELREFQDNGAVALSGITVRTAPERIARLASHLDAIQAVERFRAFRVIGAAGREERE